MIDAEVRREAAAVLEDLRAWGVKLATAESCTGGLIAAALTAVPGSSDVVDCAFVTYSNRAKTELLGVPPELIERDGAVSESVAQAMADGALERSAAAIAVAVTGVAGPDGGTAAKPVGTVWLACAVRGGPTAIECHLFHGDRATVRAASVVRAFRLFRGRIAFARTPAELTTLPLRAAQID